MADIVATSVPPSVLPASTIRVSSDSGAFFVCLPPVDYCRPPPVADTPSPAANCPPRPVDLTSVSEAAVHELDKSATSAPERPQASTSWRNDAARCEATTHHFVGPSHAANRCDGGWRNDAARREATSWRNDVADGALVVQRDFVNCYRTVGSYHAYNRCDASGAEYVRMATRMPVPFTPSDEDDEEEEESDGMPDLEESDGMPDLVSSSESDSDDEDRWPPTTTPTLTTRAGGYKKESTKMYYMRNADSQRPGHQDTRPPQ